MAYQVPPDIEQRILAQIRSGEFGTEADVLREALNALEHRQNGLRQLQEMVREADEDIAHGRVGPFDPEQTKQAVRARLREEGITD